MLKFDINMLWTLINLLLFFVLMRIFLFKPIKKTIDARSELMDSQFKEIAEKQAEAEDLVKEYSTKLEGVEEEKLNIVAQAKKDALAEYDKIIASANDSAEKIKDDARKVAQSESESIIRSAKEEIADIALQAAEKIVETNVSADVDSKLLDDFLNESSEN